MNTETISFLQSIRACNEGLSWAKTQDSPVSAWENCERGDWMLWLLGKIPGADRKNLVLVACECARLSLHLVLDGEDRPRIAIETAERWVRGEASLEEVRMARNAAADAAASVAYAADAADDADDAASAAGYAVAANAAANAASVAYAAANADAAASAARAADDAAYAADTADTAARKNVLASTANIVRKYFPSHPTF